MGEAQPTAERQLVMQGPTTVARKDWEPKHASASLGSTQFTAQPASTRVHRDTISLASLNAREAQPTAEQQPMVQGPKTVTWGDVYFGESKHASASLGSAQST